VFLLNHRGIPAKLADQRTDITDSNFGDAQPLDAEKKYYPDI
jgi:hypothetical protein